MTPMELNIKRNPYNGGLYCFFEYDGHEFYADLCLTHFDGTECMIFRSKDQQVINWRDLYCKRGIPVTEESLTECVQEFITSLQQEQPEAEFEKEYKSYMKSRKDDLSGNAVTVNMKDLARHFWNKGLNARKEE